MGIFQRPADPPLTATQPTPDRIKTYGTRPDGSPKGAGYFGEITHPAKPGTEFTEWTVGVTVDGKDMDIPLIVPTLSRKELQAVLQGKETRAIIRKAVDHALSRMKQGRPVYAEPGEYYPLPKE